MGLCVMLTALLYAHFCGPPVRGDSACTPPSPPDCYKSSRRPDMDFNCEWTSAEDMTGFSYTLHLRNESEDVKEAIPAGEELSCIVVYDIEGITYTPLIIWVTAQKDGISCSSANTSIRLDQAVRYPAPEVKQISRSYGWLWLEMDKPEDKRDADYEIRYMERGNSTWKYIRTTTKDGEPDSFKMWLGGGACELYVRRRARGVRYATWSGWSSVIYMPAQLDKPPVVRWNEILNKDATARTLKLSWESPSVEASVGGVHYHLSYFTWPCGKYARHLSTNSTKFRLRITLSVAWVSIYAINKAGASPSHNISVPAVHHRHCSRDLALEKMNQHKLKKLCWEWYPLKDGETRPIAAQVHNGTKRTETSITQIAAMENYTRYYYFVHSWKGDKTKPYTLYSCPVYKIETTPAPDVLPNITVTEVKSTSLKVCWKHIPVAKQRGFLTHYRLCLQGDCQNVSESQNCTVVQGLKPGFQYNITVAGVTRMGPGPSAAEGVWTSEDVTGQTNSWRVWTIISSLFLAFLVLLALCSFLIIRLRKKLPAVPKPVIAGSYKHSPTSEEVHPPREEVHVVTLVHVQKPPETLRITLEEGHTLLQEEGEGDSECEHTLQKVEEKQVVEEEEEKEEKGDEEPQDDVMRETDECEVALKSSYKRQALGTPEVTVEVMESAQGENECDITTPVYKNGLFFDMKPEKCEHKESFL